MSKKVLPIILSSLFMMSTLTGCKDDINRLQNQIDEIKLQVEDLQTQIITLRSDMDEKILAAKQDYQARIDVAKQDITALEEDLEELKTKHDTDKAAIEADYNASILELDTKLDAKVAELQGNIDANTAAIASLTTKHNEDIASLTNDYNAKIAALDTKDTKARADLNTSFTNQLNALNTSFQEQLEELSGDVTNNADAIAELVEKHTSDINGLTSKFEQDLEDLATADANARATLQVEFNEALSTLTTNFNNQITTLQTSITANQTAITLLSNQHTADKKTLEDDYNAKIKTLEDDYVAAKADIYSQIATLQTSVNALTTELNTQVTAIQADYTAKINALTGRVADLENVTYHTVTFDVEGAEIPSQVVKHGEKATKPELIDQTGYYYDTYWHIQLSDYSVEPWFFSGYTVTEDITLSIYRIPCSYQITLDENYEDGTTYQKSGLVYTGELFTCPVPEHRPGYRFDGWYFGDMKVTDSDGNAIFGYQFAEDITLLAHWTETAYVVDVAEALDIISELDNGEVTTAEYEITAYVVAVTDPWTSTYKNITFTIGDSYIDSSVLTVFRYSCTEDFAYQISQGVHIRVVAKLQKYYKSGTSTPETKSISSLEILSD